MLGGNARQAGQRLRLHSGGLCLQGHARQFRQPIVAAAVPAVGTPPHRGRDHPSFSSKGVAAAAGFGAAGLAWLAGHQGTSVHCERKSDSRLYPKDLEPLLHPSANNPSPVLVPPPFPGLARQQWSVPHVAPIFGLPMRGKTHVARELKRYIEFFHGARAEVFDVNNYLGEGGDERLAADLRDFFNITEDASLDKKAAYAFQSDDRGGFAIILSSDQVQSTECMWSAHTKWHRRWMAKEVNTKLGAEVVFIEIKNFEDAGKKYVKDLCEFRGVPLAEAEQLIKDYNDHYVPIQDDGSEQDTPYVQLINYNSTVVVNKLMRTFVGAEVCHFLSSLHPYQHTVYLSRHGESEFNVEKRIGGDSSLSLRGREYARRLAEFADYVVCGKAENLVCVTLSPEEVQSLPERLAKPVDGKHFVVTGSWSCYGDTSGATVVEGMQLVKVQPGYGKDFVPAPDTAEGLLDLLGSGLCTLCLVQGDTSSAGQTPSRLWTSSLRRTIETAEFIRSPQVEVDGVVYRQMLGRKYRNLDEVYAGEYDGLTEEEIKERAPVVLAARKRDKLGFRYPRGESYYDIIARLDSVMKHLERVRNPLLLISHQAVLRLVMGWLLQRNREEAIDLEVPQHEVIRILQARCFGSRQGPATLFWPTQFCSSSLLSAMAKLVVPSDITIVENKLSIGKRRLGLFEQTGLLMTAPMIHLHYSKIDKSDMRAVLSKKYDPDDVTPLAKIVKARQQSVHKSVVSQNFLWGGAFTMTGLSFWSFRRYNYHARLISAPFMFYIGTFVGRAIGDIVTGRNGEFDRDRTLGLLPGKIYFSPGAES